MSAAAVTPLLELARDVHVEVTDRWGRSAITLAGVELDRAIALAALPGMVVTALVGHQHEPIRVGNAPPDQAERATAVSAAGSDRTQAEVLSAATGSEVVRLIVTAVQEIEVAFVRRGWTRTFHGLEASLGEDWAAVADDLSAGQVDVEGFTFRLVAEPGETRPAALPAVHLAEDRPDGSGGDVWDLLAAVCDAAAWTNIAEKVDRDEGVRVALHADQDPVIPVTPATARGGSRLLQWLTGTSDANRDEALRYVMRLVTASVPDRLPDARTVQKLAERQRIALSRDRAAEVQRAIADGHRDTVASLGVAARDLADVIDEANKASTATVAGVLGIVAIVARSPDALPTWLILAATVAATAGILAVLLSRRQRIGDQETAIARLLSRLRNDPLLPTEECDVAEQSVAAFDLPRRARRARRWIFALGAMSCAVAVAGALWLIDADVAEAGDKAPMQTSTTR